MLEANRLSAICLVNVLTQRSWHNDFLVILHDWWQIRNISSLVQIRTLQNRQNLVRTAIQKPRSYTMWRRECWCRSSQRSGRKHQICRLIQLLVCEDHTIYHW